MPEFLSVLLDIGFFVFGLGIVDFGQSRLLRGEELTFSVVGFDGTGGCIRMVVGFVVGHFWMDSRNGMMDGGAGCGW